MPEIRTPYYLLDERRIARNLEIVRRVREQSGAKSVLALKCFATWSVFPLIAESMDGTTSSSLNEARLGYETFGKETHAYSVAWTAGEVEAVASFADKVIFNSASQLRAFHELARHRIVGVRVNPGISHSHFDLADPARRFSRLGITDVDELRDVLPLVSGLMFHFNCENDDVGSIERSLDTLAERYAPELARMDWISLGGGIAFTSPGYDVDRFCEALRAFADRFGVQVYLEPGEAVITNTAELVTTVLDVVRNEIDVAVVDASVEAHMPDHLIYGTTPQLSAPGPGDHPVIVAGRTCLAGDSFGEHRLAAPLKVGDEVRMADAAGYTMVKTSWFNGVTKPSIVVQRLDGSVELVREFGYDDFKRNLS
ncbi:MAG: carboxynorspermidine decarboxylase [Acidimicrobiales bacterium]|nr:carboxynorspermidine decarboxylase [Acidimicrobiales bacterium]